jgi:hypothetical protein
MFLRFGLEKWFAKETCLRMALGAPLYANAKHMQ